MNNNYSSNVRFFSHLLVFSQRETICIRVATNRLDTKLLKNKNKEI